MGTKIGQARRIDNIMVDQTAGKQPDQRVPQFKKNYTPITTFFKSLTDARVTQIGGSKITSLRPNLNYS